MPPGRARPGQLSSSTVVQLSDDQAKLAIEAFRRFGKGRHPAGLNFGDCFSYTLAKATGEPLLFKGDGFPDRPQASRMTTVRRGHPSTLHLWWASQAAERLGVGISTGIVGVRRYWQSGELPFSDDARRDIVI